MKVRAELVLLAVIALLGPLAALRWRASESGSPALPPLPNALALPRRVAVDTLDHWAQATIDGDPFRLSRTPSTTPFSRNPTATAPVEQIRPSFVLKGIIGPPWMAILDGLPGAPPGSVIQAGATFDKIVIRRVTSDSVVIQGPDTTWRLGLPRRGP